MKTEFVKNLERKNYLFTFIVSLWSHGYLLRDKIGVGFMRSVFTYSGDAGILFHQAEDILDVEEAILNLINNKSTLIDDWYKKAKDLNFKSDYLIDDCIKLDPNNEESFKNDLSHFLDVFLYSTVIPYWVLATIDTQIKKGVHIKIYQDILDKYEELRAQTRYPQLVSARIDKYLWALNKKSDVDFKLLSLLAPDELASSLFHNKLIDTIELNRRKKWCLISNTDKRFELLFDYDINGERNMLLPKEDINVSDSLVGHIAYKGVVRGVVKIVNTVSEIYKINDGDILVSINTNPTLMPAIIKSGGIVTDEGGIMCHASIVSRELKKACIVGTKNATKVLKDGDIVEVDADKGIVRIIHPRKF